MSHIRHMPVVSRLTADYTAEILTYLLFSEPHTCTCIYTVPSRTSHFHQANLQIVSDRAPTAFARTNTKVTECDIDRLQR